MQNIMDAWSAGPPSDVPRQFDIEFLERMVWSKGRLTYLHAAFMYLFHQFGYEWALDPCTEEIRYQLMHPEEQVLTVRMPVIGQHPDVDIPPDRIGVGIISQPEGLRGFLVTLPELQHVSKPISVSMPLFGCDYPPGTEEWQLPGAVKIDLLRDTHRYLTDPARKWMGHRLASECLSQ